MSLILVTGGTGFVGRNLVRELVGRGRKVRILVRQTSNLDALQGLPLESAYGDVTDPPSLRQAVPGVTAVAHLAAVIREKGQATFERVNLQGTINLLAASREAGVRRFLYMSNLGAGLDPRFPFLYSKGRAEEEVKASGIPYTIFRSSVMFGEDDVFINTLADLVRKMPIVPILGSGRTQFQMISVKDTARCLALALEDDSTLGRVIPLGGPEHLSYEEIVAAIIQELGARRLKVHLPLWAMRPLVWLMERFLARPPVTSAQLAMLAVDNITELEAVERAFGFKPTPLREGISYIRRAPSGGTSSPAP